MLDHGALTDYVLAALTAGIAANVTGSALPLVGDGVAPADGGWIHGQPGDGVFRPYVALVSGGASPINEHLDSFNPDWSVTFSLRSFGGSRKQCDWMATLMRGLIAGLAHHTVGSWSIIGIRWGSWGPVRSRWRCAPCWCP